MKKMNNKGFSLVELIIVIAIMAILAGALAPALIKYINKTRLSSDVTTGKSIATAVQTALASEAVYDYVAASGGVISAPLGAAPSSNVYLEEVHSVTDLTKVKVKAKKDLLGSALDSAYYVYVDLPTNTVAVGIADTAPNTIQAATTTGGSNVWPIYPTMDDRLAK